MSETDHIPDKLMRWHRKHRPHCSPSELLDGLMRCEEVRRGKMSKTIPSFGTLQPALSALKRLECQRMGRELNEAPDGDPEVGALSLVQCAEAIRRHLFGSPDKSAVWYRQHHRLDPLRAVRPGVFWRLDPPRNGDGRSGGFSIESRIEDGLSLGVPTEQRRVTDEELAEMNQQLWDVN